MISDLYRKAFSGIDRNVWILSAAMFVNRSGSMVLLFTSLYLTNELHFTMAQAGLAMSFYGAGSIAGSYAGGWLTDRRSYYEVMILSLVLSGIILPTILLAKSLELIACIIFVYAFVGDMFRPAMSKGIAFYSTTENRTRSVSLLRLAINLGFSVGPAVGGFIAFYLGYKPLMLIDGLTSILAGLVVFLYIPKHTGAPQTVAKEMAELPKSAYRDWEYLVFVLLVAFYGICFFQLFASVPQYLDKVWHMNEKNIGYLLALNGLLVVLIEMPLMAFLENTRSNFFYITLGAVCLPISFAILWFSHGLLAPLIIYTLIITLSEILAMPFMMNFSLSRGKASRQGQYAALYSMAYGVANIFAPIAGLGLANYMGFDKMYLVVIGTSLIVVLGFWLLKLRIDGRT